MVAGHTGQLSLITAVLNTGGNLVRTFTTVVLYIEDPEGDWLGLLVMTKSLILNSVIVLQVYMYPESLKENKTGSESRKHSQH